MTDSRSSLLGNFKAESAAQDGLCDLVGPVDGVIGVDGRRQTYSESNRLHVNMMSRGHIIATENFDSGIGHIVSSKERHRKGGSKRCVILHGVMVVSKPGFGPVAANTSDEFRDMARIVGGVKTVDDTLHQVRDGD